ncbi:(Na+)-NQR maturation NqrM, partial [Reinekea sp.]|uniref:(Na+)-NQR maturation NqrM n=1 Tax=Reinekea sp. TaxID=1970455 RepID=UPI002A822F1F
MSTILVAFVFMLTVVALMAVGVIFGRKPIAGSCGGMAAIGMLSECDVCGGDQTICDEE